MIPQRLTLKNFLSYREATLDFQGLHTACICGANGAGKSSLLEAIAWAVWGQSRAACEDDIIHLGTQEAQVDFIFTNNQQIYRIIRSRYRGQGTVLEFQVGESGTGSGGPAPRSSAFRPLTAKGVRATQQLILEHLKLDYETFINSAYLRQGRADEFMLKRPGERKEILADLLKLDQYDVLAERAKDQARQLKGQIELLEQNLESMQAQIQQSDQIAQEQAALDAVLARMQQQQVADSSQLQSLQAIQHQRQIWQQELTWQQQQQRVLTQDCQRLQQELAAAQHQHQELESLLQQEGAIATGFYHFQSLQVQEEVLAGKLKSYQLAQNQRQEYQQQQQAKAAQLQNQLQMIQAQLDALQQQENEIQQVLSKSTEIETALAQLQQARARLVQLDQMQAQVAPLVQRRQQIQSQLDRAQTRLTARLEELRVTAYQLHTQQERQPKLQQSVLEVSHRIETLEERRAYQQQVREKGLERRNFMERLQAHQRDYETQLANVEQKVQMLLQGVVGEDREGEAAGTGSVLYPPCPLCDRPLDEHHWNLVLEKHQIERQEILDQIWMIREQLSVSEREIQVLRQEYRELEQELEQFGSVLERRGQLQEQLQATAEGHTHLQQITAEMAELERSLQTGDFATDLQQELRLLEHRIHQLNYDEKNHALARGDVDRWRWAEIRQAEIKQAQRRQTQIAQRQPELEAQLTNLQHQLEQVNQETATRLDEFDRQILEIGYDLDLHNNLRKQIREAQPWQLRYQELYQARQQYPQAQQRVQQLTHALQDRQQTLQSVHLTVEALVQQLEQTPDCRDLIYQLEQQIQKRRSHLDEKLAYLGRLQQQQQQLEELRTQTLKLKVDLQSAQRRYRIYHELSQAFGKNGIQALMIENALPQLEAETNQILSRLSANQLHVQFVTQRAGKGNKSGTKSGPRLIDTLDILIADARGTRPYETYSGGEAFRVNFAIRLALARLLAYRSGMALQMLIIDEGFGTQDAEGCDRLIAAINAIASDFACILTVTHVPHFKEAFQSRVEVYKTENGSQLSLSV
ncbi:exonuclease subunit SbcC [Leptothermofonsia sichuanensis E412]|uniref:exonuclease subunit SbcC n=1 Tax=Leptothermofonsia sichuanensis TaxID=2917832 RepID=UPI001CA73040|nr:exonuclease subunit SbcC [Leptothermofonsia sichuanensis]QZZ23683.1 exonuclease subunit SbcC [Leptothermofonsia sichuanensis E412]